MTRGQDPYQTVNVTELGGAIDVANPLRRGHDEGAARLGAVLTAPPGIGPGGQVDQWPAGSSMSASFTAPSRAAMVNGFVSVQRAPKLMAS